MVIELVTKNVVATVTVWVDGEEDIWEDTAEVAFEDTAEDATDDTAEELEESRVEVRGVETAPYAMIWPATNTDRLGAGLLMSNPAAHAARKINRTRALAVLAPFLSTSFLDIWQNHEHLIVV